MTKEKKGFEHPQTLFMVPVWVEGCDDCPLWFENWRDAIHRCGFGPLTTLKNFPPKDQLEGIVGIWTDHPAIYKKARKHRAYREGCGIVTIIEHEYVREWDWKEAK